MQTTGNRIVIEPVYETPSDIIYVPPKKSRYRNTPYLSVCGKVVAVGPGRRTRLRQLIPVDVKIGDYVYHSDSCCIAILDNKYNVIKEDDVMFVSEELLPVQWRGAEENYENY